MTRGGRSIGTARMTQKIRSTRPHGRNGKCPVGKLGIARGRGLTHCRAMTAAIAGSCACVTCCSSMASDTYAPGAKYGITDEFGIGEEVATLSISLFVAGLGSGPREYSTVDCIHTAYP